MKLPKGNKQQPKRESRACQGTTLTVRNGPGSVSRDYKGLKRTEQSGACQSQNYDNADMQGATMMKGDTYTIARDSTAYQGEKGISSSKWKLKMGWFMKYSDKIRYTS